MSIDCKNLEQALREGEQGTAGGLAQHVEACASCRERIRSWEEISHAARAMRRHWESPTLWDRIERALAAEGTKSRFRRGWGASAALFSVPGKRWFALAAGAAFLFVSLGTAYLLLRNSPRPAARLLRPDPDFQKKILTEKALREIEDSEAAYIQSIEKLSALVEPRLDKNPTPLMVSYREKLMLLDSAIAECRANISRNVYNAYLRRELLSIYQEKQRTLQDLIKEN